MEEFVKKLLERLKEHHNEVRYMYLKGQGNFAVLDGTMRGIEDANAIIVHLAKKHNGGWIPVSERLPEDAGDYLVTQYNPKAIDEYCNGCRISTIFFDNNSWWDDIDFSCGWEIIAWQPLPSPYTPPTNSEIPNNWQQQTMNRFERVE